MGAIRFILNTAYATSDMQIKFTTKREKLYRAIKRALVALSWRPCAAMRKMPYATLIPAFTMGGSSDAEIATPTSVALTPPDSDTATPAPDGTATAMPVTIAQGVPLNSISLVGHFSNSTGEQIAPTMSPTTKQIPTPINSVRKLFQTR
eukprot:Colp12_sorted_trinity150504_noHs@25849